MGTLERQVGGTASLCDRPSQPGDVRATYASIERLQQATGFTPHTSLVDGRSRFVGWYRDYYAASPIGCREAGR